MYGSDWETPAQTVRSSERRSEKKQLTWAPGESFTSRTMSLSESLISISWKKSLLSSLPSSISCNTHTLTHGLLAFLVLAGCQNSQPPIRSASRHRPGQTRNQRACLIAFRFTIICAQIVVSRRLNQHIKTELINCKPAARGPTDLARPAPTHPMRLRTGEVCFCPTYGQNWRRSKRLRR